METFSNSPKTTSNSSSRLELSTNDLRRILAAESSIIEMLASIMAGDYLPLEIP